MWDRKRRAALEVQRRDVATDTGQAQAIRAEAVQEKREVAQQAYEVESIARRLNRRRAQNHFGTDIQMTFTPRGRHT